jgi:hypothetical protein
MTQIVRDGFEIIINKKIYIAMRGAFVWPIEQTPGYCCLFGVTKEKNKFGSRVYTQLVEISSHDLTEFLESILEIAEKYYCEKFYAPTGKEYRLQKKMLYNLSSVRNNKISIINSNNLPGCSPVIPQIISLSNDGMIEIILDSILDKTLHSLTVTEFEEAAFPEVKALCNLIASLEFYPPQIKKKGRRKKRSGTGYS